MFKTPYNSYNSQATTIHKGKSGEQIAISFLKRNGFDIVDVNYRCPLGEIDIIARDKMTIVFVEVKTKFSSSISPKYSVNFPKQQKIIKSALYYLKGIKGKDRNIRFDVVSITFPLDTPNKPEIEFIKNAFIADGSSYYF